MVFWYGRCLLLWTGGLAGDFVVCLHSHKQLYLAFKFIVGKDCAHVLAAYYMTKCVIVQRTGSLNKLSSTLGFMFCHKPSRVTVLGMLLSLSLCLSRKSM
eukprot:333764-Amphidinium_carterae.1